MISKAEIEWYKEIVNDIDIVFDVGCRYDNVFYELNPSLELHLFDPLLKEDVAVYSTIKRNKVALSDNIGKSTFYPEYSSMHKRNFKDEKWDWVQHNSITITTSTVDAYCADNNIKKIDLLKIDTEGNDYNVLKGATKMLPNIKFIQFENWNEDVNGKIIELLADYDIEFMQGKPGNYKAIRR